MVSDYKLTPMENITHIRVLDKDAAANLLQLREK